MARQRTKYKLWLVIDEEEDVDGSLPYDLDNANPWPLGTYDTKAKAIKARNSMVVVSDSAAHHDVVAALQTVVRQIEGGHPVGNDAFLAARRALKRTGES